MRALIGARHFEEALAFHRGSFNRSMMFSIGSYHIIAEFMKPLLQGDDSEKALPDLADQSYATNALAIALL